MRLRGQAELLRLSSSSHMKDSPPVKCILNSQAYREPDKELLQKASDDYLRCILAKSIAEVYRKITPKYRNEAARKQFFKRLLEISESIHLTGSSDQLHELITPSEPDDATTWVNSELHSLLDSGVDLAVEHASKLSSAKLEFKAFLRQLEHIVGVTWQESERHQPSLTIASFFPFDVVESEDTWRWGSQWYNEIGVLNVNPPMLFFDVLRKGVVAREAAVLLSPRNLDTMEYAPRVLCEQAEYLAYRLLDRKNDKELWSEARHGLRQQTRFRGHELVDFFHFYEMMVGDSLYREVWSRLRESGAAHLTVSDYYIIFNTLASRPSAQEFNESELRLLNLLCKKSDVRAGEAARLLRVSVPTAMKQIRELSRKAGLRFTVIVDMQRLGLEEDLVLINSVNQQDVIRIFSFSVLQAGFPDVRLL